MNAALVPVKALAAGKSRLAGRLPEGAQGRLALAMLGDVVETLRASGELAVVVVVTPDPRVAEEAAQRLEELRHVLGMAARHVAEHDQQRLEAARSEVPPAGVEGRVEPRVVAQQRLGAER
ncbi:MAG TPA: hypothetical protein VNE71_08190, partial [Myxococcota bacterium]|nr:hypothetical protein [Myxococcota bacterium]